MGTLIPLGDASRRPVGIPVVTVVIILTNAFVFALELMVGRHLSPTGRRSPPKLSPAITGSRSSRQCSCTAAGRTSSAT